MKESTEQVRKRHDTAVEWFDNIYVVVGLCLASVAGYKLVEHLWKNDRPFVIGVLAFAVAIVLFALVRKLLRKRRLTS